ncbi:MAG TPA: DUF3551 domain-containing protein, partial [Xanthobacteraceae bacterium]
MRVIALVLVGLAINTFAATESDAAASNAWCATYSRQGGISENCGYATLAQCRAQVLGLGGWCRPNPFPERRLGRVAPGHPPSSTGGPSLTTQAGLKTAMRSPLAANELQDSNSQDPVF